MTPRQEYLRKWLSCQRCPLADVASKHVILRGSIPARILLVGEAPGPVEDRLGKPFVGPSGQILTDALRRLNLTSYCITNIVCCIPRDSRNSHFRPPTAEETAACQPHLEELLALCKPRLVVSLGEVARKHLAPLLKHVATSPSHRGVVVAHARHPAYVLRRGGRDSLEHRKFIWALQAACQDAGVPCYEYYKLEQLA